MFIVQNQIEDTVRTGGNDYANNSQVKFRPSEPRRKFAATEAIDISLLPE